MAKRNPLGAPDRPTSRSVAADSAGAASERPDSRRLFREYRARSQVDFSMTDESLIGFGFKPFFQRQAYSAIQHARYADSYPVRVAGIERSGVTVWSAQGERHIPSALLVRVGEIAVGDWLMLDTTSHRALLRLERQTLLARKAPGTTVDTQLIAANIDTLVIVSSCSREFNPSRLERYLSLALDAGITPLIVLTKADVAEDPDYYRRTAERLRAGVVVEVVDARDAATLAGVIVWFAPGETLAMVGSSGVGKTTLANTLGAPPAAVGAVREADQKGRHTTTARSMYRLPTGALLIDNPGIRELQLAGSGEGILELFDDIPAFDNCRYADCSHSGEPGCAVQRAIDDGKLDARRLASYQKLLAEQRHNTETLAEKRERDRRTGRMYKNIMACKKGRRRNT